MFPTRLYYALKPLLPWPIRMGIRRWFARRKRRRVTDIWPILPGSEKPPANWPGWPEGKQFAFVLTHDVESQKGLDRVKQLAELEMSLGFRSSFNFIPENSYRVPDELLHWLTSNGFEVGVHDLYHKGHLYRSRESFRQQAVKINQYLEKWNAVGFRSGFMHHNLEWLHDLGIQYDASTFDTDPFEPQPDGTGTIFPFWVPNPNSQPSNFSFQLSAFSFPGYVELPYTLPQDHTLFVVLQEKTIAIWKQKVDWIASQGGMALLTTHPDYTKFLNNTLDRNEMCVSHYQEFLEYVRDRHAGLFWHALPREVAAFAAPLQLPVRPRPRRICMVTHSHYESDNRVIRYAETLTARGDHVDVLALQRSSETPREEMIRGVHVVRLQSRFGKTERNPLAFLFPILRFGAVCSWWIVRQNFRGRRHDLFHIHNIPDFLVFTAWLPRLIGTPIILDIHDIVPEFFASKFAARKSRLMQPLLRLMERLSAVFAHHVIIANDLWVEKYAARTGAGRKCSVFINNVDSTIFAPRSRTRSDDRLIIIFPGGLQWHQGVDIALRAFSRIRERLPRAEFHIYGNGNMKPQLVQLAGELGLNGSVRFFEPLPLHQIAEVMADADLGIVPKRADGFGNEAYSTKIMEFMSLGVPVVISSTKIDRFYFDDSVVRFFESGNETALADAAVEVLSNPGLRQGMVIRASAYAARHSWESRKADYLQLADSLISKTCARVLESKLQPTLK